MNNKGINFGVHTPKPPYRLLPQFLLVRTPRKMHVTPPKTSQAVTKCLIQQRMKKEWNKCEIISVPHKFTFPVICWPPRHTFISTKNWTVCSFVEVAGSSKWRKLQTVKKSTGLPVPNADLLGLRDKSLTRKCCWGRSSSTFVQIVEWGKCF